MAATDDNFQMREMERGSFTRNLYPITKAENVNVTVANNIPPNANTAKKVFEKLSELAFDDGTDLVYLGGGESQYEGLVPESEIDDTKASASSTWSSAKLKQIFELLGVTFDSNMNPSV